MAVDNTSATSVSSTFLNTLQNPTPTKTDSTGTLGKDSFLQLLVTQMKNQNPLDPQDNTQFVAQLAQFSSLESMQNLTSTVDTIASSYKSSQALQASSLVGRSVIIDASSTSVDTTKGLTGSIVVPGESSLTTVKVYDAQSNLVDSVDLGTQKPVPPALPGTVRTQAVPSCHRVLTASRLKARWKARTRSFQLTCPPRSTVSRWVSMAQKQRLTWPAAVSPCPKFKLSDCRAATAQE